MTWNDLVALAEAQSISVRTTGGLTALFGTAPPLSADPSARTIFVSDQLLAIVEVQRRLNIKTIGAFLHEMGHIVDLTERGITTEAMLPLYQKVHTTLPVPPDEQTIIVTAERNAWIYAQRQATGMGYRIPRWFIALCLGTYLGQFAMAANKPSSVRSTCRMILTVAKSAWSLSQV